MGIANNTPYTTEGFANDNSDFEGIKDYDNWQWVLTLAIAEVSLWRRAATLHKSKPTTTTHVPV